MITILTSLRSTFGSVTYLSPALAATSASMTMSIIISVVPTSILASDSSSAKDNAVGIGIGVPLGVLALLLLLVLWVRSRRPPQRRLYEDSVLHNRFSGRSSHGSDRDLDPDPWGLESKARPKDRGADV